MDCFQSWTMQIFLSHVPLPYFVSSRKQLLIGRTVSLEAFKFCCAYDVLTIYYVQGRWKWSDGTDMDYTHWLPGEPNQGTDNNCMVLGASQLWFDFSCTVAAPDLSAVCKMQSWDNRL